MQHSLRAWSLSRASLPSAAASTLSAARLNAASVAWSGDCASGAADGPSAVMRQMRGWRCERLACGPF